MSSEEMVKVSPSPDEWQRLRLDMVDKQIRRRGIRDERVLEAMSRVPRHEFVPEELQRRAYGDEPLPIGEGQTISQPYMVAAMTGSLGLQGGERVLEVGTGCGYQAAVLSELAKEIYSVELRPELARAAGERLGRMGYANVQVHSGDGSLGWPEFAPFDAILVAAGAPAIPAPLLEQLKDGGRMVVPVGSDAQQELMVVIRRGNDYELRRSEGCRFVPLQGAYGWKEHGKA
jgi:protein-L-isoaspartate(D-aspartate) O-methyltransferase